MTAGTFHAGAVLYAKDLSRMQAFYHGVLGLEPTHAEADHVVLASPAFQLVVVRTPSGIASTIDIDSPARPRTEAAIKLAFAVDRIAAIRVLAAEGGGEIFPVEREWDFHDQRVCDGRDPEGNIIQLRERRR